MTSDFLLNEGEPAEAHPAGKTAAHLRHLMNQLQGAYFETAAGRIAYEQMAGSDLFRQYVECSRQLQNLDLSILETRAERLAFWINLFNVLIIHGVVTLRIRDSVKEVPRFFRRIRYRIGGEEYSADDIEHGILRGNRRFPHSLFHPFGSGDARRRQMIEPLEPRIHFALVCASRSCPPIEIYQAEKLDEQLDISGRTFLNAGGLHLDRAHRTVRLSQVFDWYADDFGDSQEERLRFLAPYLYDAEDRAFLHDHAAELRVEYSDYDWRLNRTETAK